MFDTILVAIIVLIAACFVGRRLYRQFSGKGNACGCSGCGQADSCSSAKSGPGPSGCDRSS